MSSTLVNNDSRTISKVRPAVSSVSTTTSSKRHKSEHSPSGGLPLITVFGATQIQTVSESSQASETAPGLEAGTASEAAASEATSEHLTKAHARRLLNTIKSNNRDCAVYNLAGNKLKQRLRVRLSTNKLQVIPVGLAGRDPRDILKAWRRIEHDIDNWKMILSTTN
tara:strand:- start:905 stop:1405 length:501 start_codon:yes stop_codon:yes gene_type:complete